MRNLFVLLSIVNRLCVNDRVNLVLFRRNILQTDRQTDRQIDRETDKQTGRQTNRYRQREIHQTKNYMHTQSALLLFVNRLCMSDRAIHASMRGIQFTPVFQLRAMRQCPRGCDMNFLCHLAKKINFPAELGHSLVYNCEHFCT